MWERRRTDERKMNRDELKQEIIAWCKGHHIFYEEDYNEFLNLITLELEKAEKWDKVVKIIECAKTPMEKETCDRCILFNKCSSLRQRGSSGMLLIPCVQFSKCIDVLEKEPT